MARARRKTARKPARKTRTRRYKKDPYELGMETWQKAWKDGEADTRREFRQWIREHGSERIYNLFSGSTAQSKEFREGVAAGRSSMGFLGGEWRAGRLQNPRRRRNGLALQTNPRRRKNFFGGGKYIVDAQNPFDKRHSKEKRVGTKREADYYKEYYEDMGYDVTIRTANPRRRRKNAEMVWTWGWPEKIGPLKKEIGKRGFAKYGQYTIEMARPGLWVAFGPTGDIVAEASSQGEAIRAFKTFRANPRRRNVSRALLREARAAGISDRDTRRIAKRKSRAWEDAPLSMQRMKRTESGTRYWDVTSGYNSKYRYYLKKLSDGWVAEFRKMGKKGGAAPLHYINHQGTAKSHHTYFRTQSSAFNALTQHIIQGRHLPYPNPRRRR